MWNFFFSLESLVLLDILFVDATVKEVDKQIVYIMFKIILSDGTILSQQSTAVNNKSKYLSHKVFIVNKYYNSEKIMFNFLYHQ